jgi:hypothetical protein
VTWQPLTDAEVSESSQQLVRMRRAALAEERRAVTAQMAHLDAFAADPTKRTASVLRAHMKRNRIRRPPPSDEDAEAQLKHRLAFLRKKSAARTTTTTGKTDMDDHRDDDDGGDAMPAEEAATVRKRAAAA